MNQALRNLYILPLLIVASFFTVNNLALAIRVGDPAPCTPLVQVNMNNAPDSTGCITDQSNPSHNYTFLEFFSIYCSYCIREMPEINTFALENSDKTTFRMVAVDRNETEIRNFIQNNSNTISFPVALDLKREARVAYKITGTPTFVIVDKNNIVKYVHVGTLGASDFVQVRELLQSK